VDAFPFGLVRSQVMSGFSDEFYKEQLEYYSTRQLDQKSSEVLVGDSTKPAVWFQPSQVWEIKCADLTVSPTHKAGVGLVPGKPGQGLSCRFPRFIRVRADKPTEAATTSTHLVELHAAATSRMPVVPEAQEDDSDAE